MKRKLRSVKVLLFLFSFFVLNVSAQRPQHEFSVYGEGGYSAFVIQKPVSKATSAGFSVGLGVGFTGFINQNWGIHTGAGFGFFNVKNGVNKLPFITPGLIDCEGYLFDLHTTLNYYSERHKTMFVNIPLLVQYQTKMQPISNYNKNKAGFYVMAGAKALFMMDNRHTTEITSLHNDAYYPEFDNWITSQPFLGLGTFKGNTVEGALKFNMLAMFAFETGLKWQIGKKLFLYTGAYFDCGLHNTMKKSRVPYSSFIFQETLADLTLLDFSKNKNLMTIGIRVRLAFGTTKAKRGC